MSIRILGVTATLAASFFLSACSSGGGATAAQEPLEPTPGGDAPILAEASEDVFDLYGPEPIDVPAAVEDAEFAGDAEAAAKPLGPAPWTGAFEGKAVMIARTFRIEGPAGLLDHVVASSDDQLYERSVELTPDGLMQVIRRPSDDVREIRVQVDNWSLAAFDRVIILERTTAGPARIIASGEAIWRDLDGHLLQAQRLEFEGEIGDSAHFVPPSMNDDQSSDDQPADDPAGDDAESSESGDANTESGDANTVPGSADTESGSADTESGSADTVPGDADSDVDARR